MSINDPDDLIVSPGKCSIAWHFVNLLGNESRPKGHLRRGIGVFSVLWAGGGKEGGSSRMPMEPATVRFACVLKLRMVRCFVQNFKLVDPALTASPLIQHPTSLAESEALQAEATEQEYVEAVKVAIKDMQIGAERIATSEKQSGRHSRKANADGGWGTAYKKYFNQHTK